MLVCPLRKRFVLNLGTLVWLSLGLLLCSHPARAQSEHMPDPSAGSPGQLQSDPQQSGNIRGKVIDQSGASVGGATVRLTREAGGPSPEVQTDDEGQFYFVNVAPGPFELTFTSEGLAPADFSGTLSPGEA